MPYERTGYAPWSLTREAGVESATVDGTIQVPQYVYPNLDTGFIDEKGVWQGRKSDDRDFIGFTTAESVPDGAAVLFPDTNEFPSIDMSGFADIFFAIKPSNGGNCAVAAVMGPDTVPFANLTPVNAATTIRGTAWGANNQNTIELYNDSAETFVADVWNITIIQQRLKSQKNFQFKVTNNSGGASTIDFAFMRLV